MSKEVYYANPPKKCDDCWRPFDKKLDTFIDGRTSWGSWGNFCIPCAKRFGVSLGLGKGQKYKLQADNRWLKVEG